MYEIPYIGLLTGFPGNWYTHEENPEYIEYDDDDDPFLLKRPKITLLDYLQKHPEEVVDYMHYNHAINMGGLFVFKENKLKRLILNLGYCSKEELEFLNSCNNKAKYYDYWHIYHEDIKKMITPESILGWFDLYHTEDTVVRIYFRDLTGIISYMIIPKRVIETEYYGFKLGNN